MSALKYKLRAILPELSKESNANQDKEIKRHLYLIKAVCGSTKSIKLACEKRGVSTDQFYHWGKLLQKFKNLECLTKNFKNECQWIFRALAICLAGQRLSGSSGITKTYSRESVAGC